MGDDEDFDGEAEDAVGELPPPSRPKPSLNTAAVTAQPELKGGQQSTRRRWSVKSMFTPRSAGVGSPTKDGPGRLQDVIEGLRSDPGAKSAEDIAALAGSLLHHCGTHEKIAVAAKTGALEAITAALRAHATSRAVVVALLPSVINLSSGDDKKGHERVASLTQLGVIETISSVLRAIPDDATVAIRCVWALQHLCRRGTTGPTPWLSRLLGSGVTKQLCLLAEGYPEDHLLQTRVFFLIASVCYSITNQGIAAGMASSANIDKSAERAALLPAIVEALHRDPRCGAAAGEQPVEPRVGEEVHEAAAMALGDVCATPDIAIAAVEAGAIEALAAAMAAQANAGALQENAAWAVKQVCDRAAPAVRTRVLDSGAPREIVRALLAIEPAASSRIIGLREKGCRALSELCAPSLSAAHEAATLEIRNALAELGALDAATAALACHPTDPGVVTHACLCLHAVCSGFDEDDGRKQRAADCGAMGAIIAALRKAKGPRAAEVIEASYRALDLICYSDVLQAEASKQGYQPPPKAVMEV